MLIHLTKTSWTAKAVLVLVGIAFLVPTFNVSAQDGNVSFPTEDLSGLSGADLLPPSGNSNPQTFPSTPGSNGGPGTLSFPDTPPPGTLQGEELLFQQPVLTGDPVTDAEALENARAAGADALRQAGIDSSYTPGNQKPDVFGDSVLKSILYFIMISVFGTFLGWAGELLNFGINNFVIGFGTAFNTQGVGEAVNMLWSLVRDFFNILFIFGFIWIGFQMILDSGNSQAKKTLISLIMAALLVNFSLFISKFVVDFSNRLASEVAVAAFPASGNAVGNIADQEVDVATTFFQHMGIAKSLDVEVRIQNNDKAPWAYIFGSGIFYLVGAFVFAAGGIMLIIRFVALSIFMVLSPFMFLGWIFPGMQGWTDKYWKGFLGRAFYAPVYIILLFFAGTILQNFFGQGTGSMQNPGLDNPLISADSLGTLLAPFILSCAFLIAAVQVSGKMSADGAGGVMKLGGNIVQGGRRRLKNGAIGVGRGAVGGAAWAGRKAERTVTAAPRYGARMAANYSGNKLNQFIDTQQRKGNKVANNWWVDEKVRGTATNLKATKAGFSGTIDEIDRKQTKLDTRAEAWDEIEKGREASKAEFNTVDPQKIYDPSSGNIVEKSSLNAVELKTAEKAQKDREAAKAKMLGRVRDLSPADLEQLLQNDSELFADLAGSLDDSKVEKMLEGDTLNSAEKKELYRMRTDALKKSVQENGVTLSEEFAKLNIKQIELLGDEFIRDNADMFTQDQLDAVKKSDKFTATQKGAYMGARKSKIKTTIAGGSNSQGQIDALLYKTEGTRERRNPGTGKIEQIARIDKTKFKKPKEIASLPFEALTTSKIVGEIPVDAVKQIGRDNAGGKSHLSADEVSKLHAELSKNGSQKVRDYLGTTRAQRDFLDEI